MQAQYIGMFQAGWFVESMWSQTLGIHGSSVIDRNTHECGILGNKAKE